MLLASTLQLAILLEFLCGVEPSSQFLGLAGCAGLLCLSATSTWSHGALFQTTCLLFSVLF